MDMLRIPRIVIRGLPHHVTRRGNKRQEVFFTGDYRQRYLELLKDETDRFGLRILGYGLMVEPYPLHHVGRKRVQPRQGRRADELPLHTDHQPAAQTHRPPVAEPVYSGALDSGRPLPFGRLNAATLKEDKNENNR